MLGKSRGPRPLIWRGSSKADFKAFREHVQREMGYALFLAQMGERHPTMVRTVVEVKESYDGNAYRAVYTVRYADAVYVLHAFHKKTPAAPRKDLEIAKRRFRQLLGGRI